MMGQDLELPEYARRAAWVLVPLPVERRPTELGRRKQTVDALVIALQARSRLRLQRRRLLAAGGAAAVVLVALGFLATNSWTPAPLARLEGGAALQAGSVVSASAGRSVGLSLLTGTRVRLTDGGRLDLAELGVRQRFVLQSGRFWAKVAPLAAGQRFLVVTPDAEVEVRGTVFEVGVVPPRPECDGAATEVRVLEGRVTVRRNGRQWQIPAGQGWPGDCRPPASPAVPAVPALPERPTEPPVRRPLRPAAPRPAPKQVVRAPEMVEDAGPAVSTLAEQNQLFAAAMDARRRGDMAEARRRPGRIAGAVSLRCAGRQRAPGVGKAAARRRHPAHAVTSARTLLALVLWGAIAGGGCSSTLRFDDHSIEAGAPADAAMERPGNCATESCGFTGGPCRTSSCSLECPQLKSCSGSCGPSCSVHCEENSTCMLSTGDSASLRCEEGSRCSFQVGRSSSIECDRDSDCGTRCLSSCSLTCAPGAVCTLACGSVAPLAPVSGSASCPASSP